MRLSDNHKISDEFEFRLDRNIDFGITCPLVPKSAIFDLVQSIACLVLIFKKVAELDRHKISDEFEFRQNHTIDF